MSRRHQFQTNFCMHLSQTIIITRQIYTERFSPVKCQVSGVVVSRWENLHVCAKFPAKLLHPTILQDLVSAVSQSTHLLNSLLPMTFLLKSWCLMQLSLIFQTILHVSFWSECLLLKQERMLSSDTPYYKALLCTSHHRHTQRWADVWCCLRPTDYWSHKMIVPDLVMAWEVEVHKYIKIWIISVFPKRKQ